MTWGRRLLVGCGLAFLALLGYFVTHSALDGGSTKPRAHGPQGQVDARRPASSRGGPSRHSSLGAVSAATTYLWVLDRPVVSAESKAQLRVLTLGSLTSEALAAEKASGAVAKRLAAQQPAFARGWLLGWRLNSYNSTSAQVAVWTVGVLDSRAGVVAPDWSTTVCSLRWSGETWKVFAAQAVPGPTPPPSNSGLHAVTAFVKAANRFGSFDDAP